MAEIAACSMSRIAMKAISFRKKFLMRAIFCPGPKSQVKRHDRLIPLGVTQFTFPEAKSGTSYLDYIAFLGLNPASGKVYRLICVTPISNQLTESMTPTEGPEYCIA